MHDNDPIILSPGCHQNSVCASVYHGAFYKYVYHYHYHVETEFGRNFMSTLVKFKLIENKLRGTILQMIFPGLHTPISLLVYFEFIRRLY
jgi:hypothetical protein